MAKKYKTIAKTTDSVYKNTKLKADTTYTYRVRPYYYDSETGKTTYGAWAYNKVTTWGGALKLKATPKSTTSVKLSWTKIKGAKGYEDLQNVKDLLFGRYCSSWHDQQFC